MATNQAAWLDGKEQKLRVAEASMPKPDADSIVIHNKAIAINPVDWKIQSYGLFVQKWPMILGCDSAGEVVDVGSSVTRFKKGDRVIAHNISLSSSNPEDGGYQNYCSAKAAKSAILPSNISFAEGSVLPLALDTAATGLYVAGEGHLDLPKPSLNPSSSGKTIFVWGGSSSVGALTLQLARASGVKTVTTASEHNFDFCKKCGANEVISYKSSSVVDDVVAALKKLGGTFAGTYDAISEPGTTKVGAEITEKMGGGPYAFVLQGPENPPQNVKPGHVFAINEGTHDIWSDFVTQALEKGVIKCLPEPMIVGKGLESVQKGLDENKKGVSAKKVVVTLD